MGTSNVARGFKEEIPIIGTMAHSYVTTFSDLKDVDEGFILEQTDGTKISFKQTVLNIRTQLGFTHTNDGELAAFIQYAVCFPTSFTALLDTYDTLLSGVKNHICVVAALHKFGYTPMGICMDSGDLGYLSLEIRKTFIEADKILEKQILENNLIIASNELSESVILALNVQGHSIDVFAIGTNLVTCKGTPALGMVYKLCELKGTPRINFSQVREKITLPCKKYVYRLYNELGRTVVDFMSRSNNITKFIDQSEGVLCRHPTDALIKGRVLVNQFKPLLHPIWKDGIATVEDLSILTAAKYCSNAMATIRADHLRAVNPAPAKVSVDQEYYEYIKEQIEMNVHSREIR